MNIQVDRFTGLNESADGDTELKMGQSPRMENFYISDAYHLVSRDGVQRIDKEQERGGAPLLALWGGNVGGEDLMVAVDFADRTDRCWVYTANDDGAVLYSARQDGALGLTDGEQAKVKIFTFAGKLFIMSRANTVVWENGTFVQADPYVPLVITGASPAGGGATFEGINLLSPLRRVEFNGDGESTEFVLPAEAVAVESVTVDGQTMTEGGSFRQESHSFLFTQAPSKGVSNVEITYSADPAQAEENRMRVVNMTLTENYNGATDTRIFMAGDGSNICLYSGVPDSGDLSRLYFPAMNEVAVDMAAGAVTGLVRSDSKLLVFTKSGADLIVYEPVTLEDGSIIGGFYLRTANREFGNETMGQVQVVENKPRTLTRGGVYEWNFGSYYTRDERHAKRVSAAVNRSFLRAQTGKIVTCDDNYSRTYYAFLNNGTVLVNRYALDGEVWCAYKSSLFENVRRAVMVGKTMVFSSDNDIFQFASWASKDAPLLMGGEEQPIQAVWESGYMDYGRRARRKDTDIVYLSILPQSRSSLSITAKTDQAEHYPTVKVGGSVFSFDNLDFRNFTFNMSRTPKIRRARIKARRFVYYKLILSVDEPGTRATVLSFNQEIRYSGKAK